MTQRLATGPAMLLGALLAAGCAAPGGPQPSAGAGGGADGPASAAERACLEAVSQAAGGAQVTLLGSEYSQAGTFVRVGVGPDRSPWKCIGYSDGTTDGVAAMTG